jgi:hypothetical protein
MIVYRYQNSKGFGPYNGANWLKPDFAAMYRRHSNPKTHPSPRPSNYLANGCFLFGFKSITQLKNWFNEEERNVLVNNGFKLLKFAVPDDDVFKFEHQIVFFTKHAHELGEYNG